MKMKKALSIILGGIILVGSSSFVFANDLIQITSNSQDQATVIEDVATEDTNVDTEIEADTQTPTVTVDVVDEEVIIDDELEQEVLELAEEILNELEEEAVETEEEAEIDEDEIDVDEDEVTDEENQLILENLHRNLLKFQLVYDRVPAQAKPAIEKNMKKMQLKIIDQMIKMNEDIDTLCSEMNMEEIQTQLSTLNEELKNEELSEEAKQELMDSITELKKKISNHEEMTKLVEFIKENENWKKELKDVIQQEFKVEKANVKLDSKIAKEEIKIARKEIQEKIKIAKKEVQKQIKTNKNTEKQLEKIVKLEKEIKNIQETKINQNTKISNNTNEKKSHPVKATHPGKGNRKK